MNIESQVFTSIVENIHSLRYKDMSKEIISSIRDLNEK